MSDDGHILDDRDTVYVLSHHLAGVSVESDLGLMEGLEDVVTGLCAGHSLTTEAISHPAPLRFSSNLLIIKLQNFVY